MEGEREACDPNKFSTQGYDSNCYLILGFQINSSCGALPATYPGDQLQVELLDEEFGPGRPRIT